MQACLSLCFYGLHEHGHKREGKERHLLQRLYHFQRSLSAYSTHCEIVSFGSGDEQRFFSSDSENLAIWIGSPNPEPIL